MDYYIWHGEGECDNKTDSLHEARRIKQALIKDGHDAYILDSNDKVIEDPGKIRLILDVTYTPGDADPQALAQALSRQLIDLVEAGKLSGPIGSDIERHTIQVAVMPKPLTEDELADFMRQRISDGQLLAEDIPVRLARYGLMEPAGFIAEMAERMETAAVEMAEG